MQGEVVHEFQVMTKTKSPSPLSPNTNLIEHLLKVPKKV